MRILVCGDRKWKNGKMIQQKIKSMLNNFETIKKFTLIHGCANGADSLSEWALTNIQMELQNVPGEIELDIPTFSVMRFPADWARHGKAAGPIRNQQMIDEGKPDVVLVFHSDIANSKGTLDMIKRANKAGIEIRSFSDEAK